MQFEVIRKSHKKEVVIGVGAIILIAVVLLVRNSFAKYQTTKNLKIAEGTINYTVPDFKIMGIYYQKEGQTCTEDSCYEEKETMPESGYTINTIKSYCELNGSKDENAKMYTDENGQHVISKLTKGDRCYLYFDKKPCKGAECILYNVTVKESPESFTGISTDEDTGVYVSKQTDGYGDDDGDTYYWRGSVTNNYVNFAGFYWRIIRINGDGTIRLIYQGPSAASTGTNAQIGTSAFNIGYNNNMHVGFKYTSNDVHGTGEESTILGTLNTWYETNIDQKGYSGKVDQNAGFCNDRDPYTDASGTTSGGGTSTTTTYYGAYIRLVSTFQTKQTPTFKCKDNRDLFTKSGATKKDGTTANGNRSLKYPIGLITADEVVYAGGYYGTANSSYYLYIGQVYWTLSPYYYSGSYARVFYVYSTGALDYDYAFGARGVRPVINLRADTKFTYNNEATKGTMNDPYVVE